MLFSYEAFTDRRECHLINYSVTFLHIDYRFGFDVSGAAGNVNFIIEVPFALELSSAKLQVVPDDITSVVHALPILHRPVDTLVVYSDGTLSVLSADRSVLSLAKHSRYESWEAHGMGELVELALRCTPHPGPPWTE